MEPKVIKETGKKNKFLCNICGCDEWENLDHLRKKPLNFQVCQQCGFVTYEITQDKLIKTYVNSEHNPARKFSGTKDDHTKLNKLPYHRRFLGEFLEEPYQKAKDDFAILDFGCSTGYVLNMCREEYGYKDVTGIELNPAHAAYGRNEFGIPIHECTTIQEFKKEVPGKKYDLIICFAVLEHLLDPVDRMKEFNDLLKEGGHVYVMVPLWLNGLLDSEKNLTAFEQLFIPHHINCFSQNSIKNVFNLSGFGIEGYCNTMYGHMFRLKKLCKEDHHLDIVVQDYKKVIEEVSQIKVAIEMISQGGQQLNENARNNQIQNAINVYPQNPEGFILLADVVFKEEPKKSEAALKKAIEIDPSHTVAYFKLGNLYFQRGEKEEGIKYLQKSWEMSPGMYLAKHILAEIAYMDRDYKLCVSHCKEAIATNPNMKDNYFNPKGNSFRDLIGLCYANMDRKER